MKPATQAGSSQPFAQLDAEAQGARLDRVADCALACYGLTTVCRDLLQFEFNAVYRLSTESGEQFVLRVATARGRSEQEQRSEMAWLERLRSNTSLRVPEAVRNQKGETVTTVELEGSGEVYPCVVFRWRRGKPPSEDLDSGLMEQLGSCVAEMHQAAETDTDLKALVRPRWDWERLFGSRSFLCDSTAGQRITERQLDSLHAAGEQIGRLLAQTEGQGGPGDALSMGLIHGDLHRGNLLIWGEEVSFLDFDDCGHGYYLYDLTCLLDSFQRRVFTTPFRYRQGREALLRGYARVRPLAVDFDAYQPAFLALRAMAALDFILCSENPSVRAWGPARIPGLLAQVRAAASGSPSAKL